MSNQDDVVLTNASEQRMRVRYLEKYDSSNGIISIKDADGNNINLSGKEGELNVYRDQEMKSMVLQFSTSSGGDGDLIFGDGTFEINIDPMPLQEDTYRYSLRNTTDKRTLAVGDFVVYRDY